MKISLRNDNRRKSASIICSVCAKTFNRKDNYLRHFRSHTGELPHLCPHQSCTKGFTRSDQLIRHVASKHHADCARIGTPESYLSDSTCSEDSIQTIHSPDYYPEVSSKAATLIAMTITLQRSSHPCTRMNLEYLLN
ncbi:hypothetical protein K7432_013829 [Basidiobolus ranarum]|uniref:C2H2-type domain-containing protein n=1 Tax=Basidiobolus ranarum TaxID=34480 RepID=A0ABR2VQR3_9FUNG